jgi:glycosyltransferase involved in cell wall biosynthesis
LATPRNRSKVLYILHNHPELHPGGSETYAVELYEAMREYGEFEPLLVARVGSDERVRRTLHPGAPFMLLDGDPNQYLVLIENERLDLFYMTAHDKQLYTSYFAKFLLAHKPDVVHFQHTLFIGYDLISLVRQVLPEAPIVYTLQEFLPICHRSGQLVRTVGEELCLEESPQRCHECFPDIPEEKFALKKQFVQSHFANVDLFLAPSRFLLDRYADWGIPPEKIRLEDYGRLPVDPLPESDEGRPRTRLGFFGQLTPFKGADVLLEAMKLLEDELSDVHLWLYGANLEKFSAEHQERIRGLLGQTKRNVTFGGIFPRDTLRELMAEVDWVVVPSRWWENSPLVIQEAFLYGRPVICTGIGGMAEKVTDGVNGLHFEVGRPESLAWAIKRAVTTPGLWAQLRAGIPEVLRMDEHVANLSAIYRDLLARLRDGRATVQ